MKKLLSLFAAGTLAFSSALGAFAYSVFDDACIVIADGCGETDRYAAETLSRYLKPLTGAEYRIVTDTELPQASFYFAVGNTDLFDPGCSALPDGSLRIRSFDGGVSIAGAGNRGTVYAVYAFLEKYGGYRCYTAEDGMVSLTGRLELPPDADFARNVFFEYTDTDWHSPRDITYSLANGLSGGVYRRIPKSHGGTVGYLGQFCHTLSTRFCPAAKYGKEHPEYFALHNGVRFSEDNGASQLCLTNEDVYNIVLSEVMELLRAEHDPTEALQIISLTQHDNQNYCECENCKALDEANGSHAGTMITFANRIARAVKAAGYGNVAIDTFAYQYTRTAPSQVVPERNVIVRLCTIECCFSHALSDPACERNTRLMQDLVNWNKICDRLYIWDYTTNYSQTIGIFPDFGVLQQNIRCFYEHGVKGIYEEGNYYVDSCDTEFGELRAYLLSRLMQDPYCDYDAERDGFLRYYYGDAWKYIRRFIDIITENAAERHVAIYSTMNNSLKFTAREVEECDTIWRRAAAAVEDDPRATEHLRRSELSWRYWKACAGAGEFRGFGGVAEREKLYNDLIAADVQFYNEWQRDMKVNSAYKYIPPTYWKSDDFSEYAGEAVKTFFKSIAGSFQIAFLKLFGGIRPR